MLSPSSLIHFSHNTKIPPELLYPVPGLTLQEWESRLNKPAVDIAKWKAGEVSISMSFDEASSFKLELLRKRSLGLCL